MSVLLGNSLIVEVAGCLDDKKISWLTPMVIECRWFSFGLCSILFCFVQEKMLELLCHLDNRAMNPSYWCSEYAWIIQIEQIKSHRKQTSIAQRIIVLSSLHNPVLHRKEFEPLGMNLNLPTRCGCIWLHD